MKQLKPRRKTSYIILTVIFSIALIFFFFNKFGVIKYLTLKKEKNDLIEKLETAEKENARLKSQIDSLKNSDVKIERVAREKYNMKREGEKVIRIEYSK